MLIDKNRCTFLCADKSYSEAELILLGAPFDSTSSYRAGSKFGPNRIRIESEGAIESYSPYQDMDLEELKICDIGDLSLASGNAESALEVITAHYTQILTDKKIPVMMGGEHLVTLGGVRACRNRYEDLHIIHFDAHADLRDDYMGQKLSHASVIRRAWELVGDDKIFQFGIRSGSSEEFEFATHHTYMCRFDCRDIDIIIKKLNTKPLYVTIDLDILDPSIFPGTGTPEAGGISFNILVDSIVKLRDSNIVAADITEFSPICDPNGISTSVACKTLRELLISILYSRPKTSSKTIQGFRS